MKRMVFKFVFCALLSVGCKQDVIAPTPVITVNIPPPPVVAACEANRTALVGFANRSIATTYDAVFDGVVVATINPGQTSGLMIAAAGVAHPLVWLATNSLRVTCPLSAPVPPQCSTVVYTCALP